jgi:hypothetical protein
MSEATSRLELWYTALRSTIGIVVQTNDIERLRANLYRDRKDAGDPQLEGLSIFVSPASPNELWITHRNLENVDQAEIERLRKDLRNV